MTDIKLIFESLSKNKNASTEEVSHFLAKFQEAISENVPLTDTELQNILNWSNEHFCLDQAIKPIMEKLHIGDQSFSTGFLKFFWKILNSIGELTSAQYIENMIMHRFARKKRYQSMTEFSIELRPLGDSSIWRQRSHLLSIVMADKSLWGSFVDKEMNVSDVESMKKIMRDFSTNRRIALEYDIVASYLEADKNNNRMTKKNQKKLINALVEYLLRFPDSIEIVEMMAFYLALSKRKGVYQWLKKQQHRSKNVRSTLAKIDEAVLSDKEVVTESTFDAGDDLFSDDFETTTAPKTSAGKTHLAREPFYYLINEGADLESPDDRLMQKWIQSTFNSGELDYKDMFVAFTEMKLFKTAAKCLEYMNTLGAHSKCEMYYLTALLKFRMGLWNQCCQECLSALVRFPLNSSEKNAFIVLCARSYHEMGKTPEAASMIKLLDPIVAKGLVKLL